MPPACLYAGNTYERRHIASWLHTHCTDPLTNERLESKKLVPNLSLRSAAAEWRENYVEKEESRGAPAVVHVKQVHKKVRQAAVDKASRARSG